MRGEGEPGNEAREIVANDTNPITNERSIEQIEENIPHSPKRRQAVF